MRQNPFKTVALLLLMTIFCGCASGADEANRDLRRGHLELRSYGYAGQATPAYARLLRECIGVEYRSVAGCVVAEHLVKKTHAYNAVMTAEIERRFGTHALTNLRDEARSQRVTTRPAA